LVCFVVVDAQAGGGLTPHRELQTGALCLGSGEFTALLGRIEALETQEPPTGSFPDGEDDEECCHPGGCEFLSGSRQYYGHTGCGKNQYQVNRDSNCPGTGTSLVNNQKCSKCADCPAGTTKASGCTDSGIEACLPTADCGAHPRCREMQLKGRIVALESDILRINALESDILRIDALESDILRIDALESDILRIDALESPETPTGSFPNGQWDFPRGQCCPSDGCELDHQPGKYYGHLGCGYNQYQVNRDSNCPDQGAKPVIDRCSKCADCPAGTSKGDPGCSFRGIAACLPISAVACDTTVCRIDALERKLEMVTYYPNNNGACDNSDQNSDGPTNCGTLTFMRVNVDVRHGNVDVEGNVVVNGDITSMIAG
jgi:hypothetical protein